MKLSGLPSNIRDQNKSLSQFVRWMSLAVVLIVIAFGFYYYWDRYVHLGDQTPAQLGLTHIEQIVEENPTDPSARLALAQSYVQNGEYSKAIDQAQQVLVSYPEEQGALLLIGIAFTRLGQPGTAVEYLEKFTDLRRASPNAKMDRVLETSLYYLGEDYLALDSSDMAIAVLSEALEIDNTDADAMYQLGLAYAASGKNELAIQAYQKAVLFVPDFTEAFHSMAISYAALNETPYQVYASGMEAYSKKEYAQARHDLEQVANELNDFLPLHIGLALTYQQLGEKQLALASASRALEIDPHNFTANNLIARIQPTDGGN